MSIAIKFDRILGRLREKDGGSTPAPTPDPSDDFAATLSGSSKAYYADQKETDTLTVTVTLKFKGTLVDADSSTSGLGSWTRQSTGVYTRTVSGQGTIAAMTWKYTPPGTEYGGRTAQKTTAARTLTKVWPAYWGIYPGNNAAPTDITDIVAELNGQHRVTANTSLANADISNTTGQTCWLWIVTRNTATAEPAATPGISMMNDPAAGKEFTSPADNSISLGGYKAYISTFSAKAGAGFGLVNLTINV